MGAVKVMLQPIAMGAVCVFFLISGYFLYSPQAGEELSASSEVTP